MRTEAEQEIVRTQLKKAETATILSRLESARKALRGVTEIFKPLTPTQREDAELWVSLAEAELQRRDIPVKSGLTPRPKQPVEPGAEALKPELKPRPKQVTVAQAEARFAQQSPRSQTRDLQTRAKRVAQRGGQSKRAIQRQQAWLRNPSELDFEGVDTPGSGIVTQVPKAKMRKNQMRG